MGGHVYITVDARRWCRECNTFQRLRNGVWQDDEEMIGQAWPKYERTQPQCPRDYAAVIARVLGAARRIDAG